MVWEFAGVIITSLSMEYPNLPKEALWREDKTHNVERFYTQKLPTTQVGFYYNYDSPFYLRGNINTGIHTEKLSRDPTANLTLNYKHEIGPNMYITPWATLSVSGGTTHRPCRDAADRLYYCGDLREDTFEEFSSIYNTRTTMEISSVGIKFTKRF